MINIDEIPL